MPDREFSSPEQLQAYLEAWVNRLPEMLLTAAEPAMQAAITYLHGKLPEYPPPPDGSLMLPDGESFLRTPKQRAWFFAAIKKGQVPGWQWVEDAELGGHPEKAGSNRTGTLGRRFTEQVTRTSDTITGELGTNLNYAPWVVGADYPGAEVNGKMMFQSRIHVDRWWQFPKVIEENTDGVWQEFSGVFWPEFIKRARE